MHDPEYDPLSGRVMLGFVLTLIAVPVLFVATCVPLGLAVVSSSLGLLLIIGYTLVFVGAAITLAVRTENPGIRWAIFALLMVLPLLTLTGYFWR